MAGMAGPPRVAPAGRAARPLVALSHEEQTTGMQIPRKRARTAVLYLLILGITLTGYFVARRLGEGLPAPAPEGPARFGAGHGPYPVDVLLHILLALTVIILFARLLGILFRRLQQPPVIGEVVAGLLLGPSFLGHLAPELSSYLLPLTVAPFLSVIAQVGIILYMFLVGLELDLRVLRQRTDATVLVSHASIMLPFLFGTLLSLHLYPRLSTSDVPFSTFALFMGVSMSITAFPVLARILTDRGMHRSRLGALALTCAAVDDVTAWCLLALLVSTVQARAAGAVLTAVLCAGYVLCMVFLVRPLIVKFTSRHESRSLTRPTMRVACVALLLSALIGEWIGIHAIFGAFLLGALVPADSSIARELRGKLEDLVIVLFLPAYFAFTGMRTQFGLVHGAEEWLLCGLIFLVASAGKFGGSLLAARLTGSGWREASALGVLMNTRGLMELIVLNIGLDLGVISPVLFAMMVLMALATTLATSPVLRLLVGKGPLEEAGPGERQERSSPAVA
jgi:Kef-type K+ transport system membrane component KefB